MPTHNNAGEGATVRRIRFNSRIVAILAAAPTAVLAHPGHDGAQDLWAGFMHPLGGLDHVLAMLAVGVIAARLGGRALFALPLCFIGAMAAAGIIAVAGVTLPDPEIGIALSVVALGAVIALPIRLPLTVATATVVAVALFHGYAHGLEIGDGTSGVAFGIGFVLATALLHLAGIRAGLALNRVEVARARDLARTGGSLMAIAGVAILASGLIG
jgi:urease accessory protein